MKLEAFMQKLFESYPVLSMGANKTPKTGKNVTGVRDEDAMPDEMMMAIMDTIADLKEKNNKEN